MKKLKLMLIAGALAACQAAPAQKHSHEEHLSKEFKVNPESTLAIYNVYGSIEIEGYDGNEVILEIDKSIKARNEQDLREGLEEFKFNIDQQDDSLIVYIIEPRDSRPGIQYQRRYMDEVHYRYFLDFKVKVPYDMNVVTSTVNNGELKISKVHGQIKAFNVNGGIQLTDIRGKTEARTVNGDVDITYDRLPSGDSKYYTLNGDLTVVYPDNLSADCEFKSMNGEFYTDFVDFKALPTTVSQSMDRHKNSVKYKVNANTKVRIGNGGQSLKFETMNGDIFLKKQS
ncbi:DUF4097 family beta strand repeat-containing protein [Jiulongibacter sp. NS-SX5]|uniref:DUF4097 family beta strand repeat-containing protein n=1 Tax=Jiulongibacter sp. NS-SX5 TaxID=3463854 RepID=UPI0040590EAD